MKKKIFIFTCILSLIILLTSCNGLIKTNSINIDSIYSTNKITFTFDDKIEVDRGMSKIGGIWYRTNLTEEENDAILKQQGVTYLNDIAIDGAKLFQINNKGMWSISYNSTDKLSVEIREMSIKDNDIYIPFPIYAIYKNEKMQNINIGKTYENIDKEYVISSINKFNEKLKIYTTIEEEKEKIILTYHTFKIVLIFENNKVTFTL